MNATTTVENNNIPQVKSTTAVERVTGWVGKALAWLIAALGWLLYAVWWTVAVTPYRLAVWAKGKITNNLPPMTPQESYLCERHGVKRVKQLRRKLLTGEIPRHETGYTELCARFGITPALGETREWANETLTALISSQARGNGVDPVLTKTVLKRYPQVVGKLSPDVRSRLSMVVKKRHVGY